MKKYIIILLSSMVFFAQCQKNDPTTDISSEDWLIPQDEVLNGGPGKDGIPSVDNAKFSVISDVDYLLEDDLVLGIKVGNEIRAYPHVILDWHEIINDQIESVSMALTYCPLTGTGIGWDGKFANSTSTFGVSGLLYKSNLMPYDRSTDSYWSQMRLDCVAGEMKGAKIKTIPLIETDWRTWKKMFPSSKIMNLNTGFNRSYGRYPYGSYKSENGLIFPVDNQSDEFHSKERVLGIIEGSEAKVFSFQYFPGQQYTVLENDIGGKMMVVVGSKSNNLLVAYDRNISGETRNFKQSQSDNPSIIMEDSNGNSYNVFGEVITGPNIGDRLTQMNSMIGYWFVWRAFYPETVVFRP